MTVFAVGIELDGEGTHPRCLAPKLTPPGSVAHG